MTDPSPRLTPPTSLLDDGGRGEREWEDRVLLRALTDGQDHAFDLLIGRYGTPLHSYIFHLVRDAATAEDLTQEVFVKVFQKLDSHDRECSFAVWLFRIARNEALGHLRRRKVHGRAIAFLKLGQKLRSRFLPSPPDPLAALELGELTGRLDRAIAALSEGQRSVFVLRERHGMSYLEISQVVGATSKTVSTRLARARATLREELAGYLDDTPNS